MKKSLQKFINHSVIIFSFLSVIPMLTWAATPTFTSVPANAATAVNQSGNIVLTFSEAIRDSSPGNATLDNTTVDGHITLKLTDAAGVNIPFDATIDAGKTIITIDPTSDLPSSAIIYVAVADVEASSDDSDISPNPTSFTFTVTDYLPPNITFDPLNGATGVALASNLTISFDEAVRKIDNSVITAGDLLTLIELKLTDNAGAAVPFTASIDGTNTIITVDPTSNLTGSTVYYLEINPVEDVNNNAIVATSITFTSADVTPPAVTFSPINGATGVSETGNITISFDEAVRNIDDSPITAGDLLTLVELKLTNNAGASVPFVGSINGGNTIITIDPTSTLTSNTVFYVEINPVEDISNNAITASNITFTTGDSQPPTITFSPVNGATGVAVASNLTITFNEAIRKIDNSAITGVDLATLVELKLTDNAGAAVAFTASINGANTMVTIDPTLNLSSNTVYYLEINPIEDASNNATVATNITFTSADIVPPNVTFNPLNGATGVVETDNITITFDEAVRKLDNSVITAGDLLTLVELKLTNNAGATVPFTASINGSNTIITVDPTATLAGNTLYYVEINPVEDGSNNAIVAQNITFTTGDTQPPTITFNPTGGATNFSAIGNITITFNEPIRKTDNSAITPADIEGGLAELKLTNDGGAAVPFTASIDGTNTIITINPNTTLAFNQVFYVEMNIVEDASNNATTAQNITFTSEDRPSISGFLPIAGTCIGDDVTVNGSRFTGTGNPVTGNTQPTVTVNGVAIPAADIVSFNSTQVVFTLPVGSTTGTITVKNNDSDLTSANSASLNVFPAIDQSLTVTPATLSPAQNSNVNIDILNTQDGNYSYSLILTAAPGGYSLSTPATVHTASGNSATRTLNTSEGPDPDLTHIGNYTYRIDVSRTGCSTKTLTNTPFTLTVASLAVSVSATDATVCLGSGTTLIGAASGGTGFYQFRWTSTPPGFSDNGSSPTVNPTSNIRYNLELEDNAGNIVTDFIDIVVNPLPTADIVPNPEDPPNPAETSVRINYVVEDRNYLVTGSPAGGVFAGSGIFLDGNGKYYFNPLTAGVGSHVITYTYTDGNGCSAQDTENFIVNTAAINNLDLSYCRNSAPGVPIVTEINLSPNSTFPAGIQFTRLVFYRQLRYPPYTYCIAEDAPTFPNCGLGAAANPLSVATSQLVQDISQPPGVMLDQPITYTLNLDVIRDKYGYSTDNYFYILAYGKDVLGNETYRTFQYFDVFDNNPAPGIVGINENENICADTPSIPLSSSEPGYTVTDFSIVPNGFSGSLSGTNNKDFDPSYPGFAGADERPLTMQMDYVDFNNCPNRVVRNFNWVKKPDMPIANDTAFCQFASQTTFKLKARKSGSADNAFWYDNTMVELASETFIFDVPGVDGLTPDFEDFFVSQSYKGCEGDAVQATVFINPAPNATITREPICEDRDFLLTGPEESPGVPYAQYDWTFGDGQSATISGNNSITYNYGPGSAGIPRTISLTVTTSLGCTNTATTGSIPVGQNPAPDFTYNFVCENDNTQFNGTTPNVPVTEYEWSFGDGSFIAKGFSNDPAPSPESGTIEDPIHTFLNGVNTYSVTVTSHSAAGCFGSKTKTVNIIEYLTHTSSNPYNMASVDGGKGYWSLEDIAGNSTWAFAQPTSSVMDEFTSPAWVTNPAGIYSPTEYSFLNSPCLDVSDIDRPVLSLDFILNTDESRDGVVMEYSKDGGVTWVALGGVSSGFNWFNTTGFVTGTIGSSIIGWSGNSWDLTSNPLGDTLVQGRRALDNIPNLSLTDLTKVRFRIAFKTDNNRELDGFAFNNLTISSRNRVLLVENFTNENAVEYNDNNIKFRNIPITEAVKIQYHLGYPGTEDNYLINPADPSARSAYYGIPLNTNYIPRGYIDGYSDGNFNGVIWVTNKISERALKVAPYTLTVGTIPSTDPSYLKVEVTLTAIENIPGTRNPILQIAAVEKTEGDNEYVLRKLIPTAVGRVLTSPMAQGTVVTIIDSVRIEHPDIEIADLAIVAFIQDEQTREVYQAAIDLNPVYLPDQNTITGIEDPTYAEKINLFPNPANHEVNIELPAAVNRATPVVMFDTYGRVVYQNVFSEGEHRKTVTTAGLTGGVYLVQVGTPDGGVARRKVIVVHR